MTPHDEISSILQAHGIQPSAQRVAIALFVLRTDAHPTADEVLAAVRREFPVVSRATIYNTLGLFVEKGLLQTHQFREGVTVYDANTDRHHHFIDTESGEVHDIPWEAVDLQRMDQLQGYAVDSWMVVMRGRRKP
ncbi:transcriptional repressor [bacterium]|nr:transcriptional repressor [bacterium]